jgi:hypothetical protein
MATTVTYSNDTQRRFVSSRALTADTTLTPADSGKTIFLDAVGEAITLPAVADCAGVRLKFIVTAAVITTDWTIVADSAKVYGQVVEAGLVQLASAETTLTIVKTSKATFGDWITLESDGTNWYLAGQFSVAGSFTTA